MGNPTSLPTRARKGRNALVPILRSGFPRKSNLRSIANYARSMGAHIPCTTLAQLTEKMEKLEKALKKSGKKGKKRHYKDSNSDSE